MHSSQIENTLFDFIKKNTLSNPNKIKTETLIFKEGIFDSMGFILLLDFIEENFNIKTADTDLIEENFESISAMVDFINKKKAANVI